MNNIYGICTMERLLNREGLKDAMVYENQEHSGAEIAPVNECGSSYLVGIVPKQAMAPHTPSSGEPSLGRLS